jgi:hypothetical protein
VIRLSRPASFLLACVLSTAGVIGVLAVASPASAAAPVSGTYHATTPTRIFDTRTPVARVPVAAGGEIVVQVAGLGSVPASASAVVLNVTVTEPTGTGYVTVYPDGSARPGTSNLNFVPKQTVPTLVVVSVPTNGKVHFYNGSVAGSVHLFADVSGYYTGADAPSGQGAFGAITPRRLLDTRGVLGAPKPALAAFGSVAFTVTGNGVPAGASAVVLNVTATAPAKAGYITAYPHGAPIPTASNVNFLADQTVPNVVVVPVGPDGQVSLYNGSQGTVHLLADISGYFLAGDPVGAGTLGALAPVRLLDTRTTIGGAAVAVPAFATRTLSVRGRGGVPLAGTGAVILNVTVAGPTGTGFLTVYGTAAKPNVSNLNFTKGQTVPNLVVTQVSATGTVTFYNGSNGSVQILADVSGYVPTAEAPLPVTSTSRYIRNITGVSSDVATMQAEGCADVQAGSTFVLLDIGAQSNSSAASSNGTVLSPANPGVRLTNQTSTVRLTYPQLRTAVDAYTLGLTSCGAGPVTVAIGTSSSGFSATYPAAAKGADWANEVIDKLVVRPGVSVAGANDIEASFGDTQLNALAWENAYLGSTVTRLVYSGSADNCPVTFGSTADCGAVLGQVGPNWTRANYAYLTHGLSPARITALPQIYYSSQAVQWANINATAGNAIIFAGVLTENASACGVLCAMTPGQSWAALYHSISTSVSTPSIPVVTDLQVDSGVTGG